MTLEKYNTKRDFKKTSEPKGKVKKSSKKKIFVIQYHRARKEHYDFRLEHDGVLLSWAVPKGLSYDTKIKRLAVHVEDHPLDYAGFEGIIPKGNYGAGTVEIFDEGYYEEEYDFDEGLKKGHLKFELFGKKFKGCWSLIKTDEKIWLIVKADDKYANKKDIVALKNKNPFKRAEPMLALISNKIPKGKEWLFEIKYDGYRIMAYIENGKAKLYSRNHNDYSLKFTEISESLEKMSKDTPMVLDGEVVCFDKNGRSDFGLLQQNIKSKRGGFVYVVFDILSFNGEDLRDKELIERKGVLKNVLVKCPKNIMYSDYVVGKGKESFDVAKKLNLEGIIAKKASSTYSGNRNGDWLKIKCYRRQEFVIGGYTTSEKNKVLSAILVGYYENKMGKKAKENKDLINNLVYIGKVGTGFDETTKKELVKKFNKLKQKEATFLNVKDREEIIWLKPELVAEIQFAEITKAGNLRQPSFIGLRTDKNPTDVVLEMPNEN